jgi:hypothetical protein
VGCVVNQAYAGGRGTPSRTTDAAIERVTRGGTP